MSKSERQAVGHDSNPETDNEIEFFINHRIMESRWKNV